MNAEKAAYWLALAAFGFALLDVCPRGVLQNVNNSLGHTGSTLCRLATNAERAVMASAFIRHPHPRRDFSSATGTLELAQLQKELAQERVECVHERVRDQAEQAREQAKQIRDQAIATTDATRGEALAEAEAMREVALARAEAIREQALAQAAMARARARIQLAEVEW